MIATFIGHRKIQNSELLTEQIKQTVLNLIDEKQVDTFLFGSRSAFDDLCLETVTEIKKLRPHIKRIYVRAAYPYIDSAYEAYLLKFYDATYIPDKIENAGKAAYVERNEYMIDKADVCIFYYNENYQKTMSFGDNRIREAIEKYNAKLLILDPLSTYIGENCSMNNANETRTEFNHLIAVAKDTGCAIVIIAHMGFRSPYKKESWQRKQLTSTMLFDVNEDKTFNCINFVYKPQEGMSLMQEIRQFAADVALNLSGPYLLYIAQMNGLTN